MTSEFKMAILGLAAIGGIVAIPVIKDQIDKYREARTKIRLAEIEKEYPPEYWEAKTAEAHAKEEIEKAEIESRERLTKDERDRRDSENDRIREYEKDAPAGYWEQKKVEAETEAKIKLAKEAYEAERRASRDRKEAITEGIEAAERAIEKRFRYYLPGSRYSSFML